MTLVGSSKFFIVAGALCAALSVGMGAFGAHGLKDVIAKTYTPAKLGQSEPGQSDSSDQSESEDRPKASEAPPETEAQFVQRRLANWDTGARYQMYHAIGLILVGLFCIGGNQKLCGTAALLFLVGIVLFSGMLYVLVLTNIKILGAIVPLGGLSFIFGWLCFALAIRKIPTGSGKTGSGRTDDQ